MNSGRKLILALAAAGTTMTAGAVQASQGSASITITGHVPVVCRVSMDNSASATLNANSIGGQLHEFCNNGAGYRVVATYSKQLAAGRLIVDGQTISLDGSGEVVISDVSHAASTMRTIAVESSVKSAGSIRFRIEPR